MASAADHHERNGGPISSGRLEFLGVGVIVVRRDEVLNGLRRARAREACARWSWFRRDDAPEPLLVPVAGLQAKGFRP